jgi:hypothetical protein
MSLPALDGQVDASEAIRLRREITGLEAELAAAKDEAAKFKQLSKDAVHAIRALRQMTEPWLTVLKMLHGEISRVNAEAVVGPVAGVSSRDSTPIWQERISKVGGAAGRILQVLVDGGGPMSLSQITRAAGSGGSTSARLSELMAKNWVQKAAHGSYELKN